MIDRGGDAIAAGSVPTQRGPTALTFTPDGNLGTPRPLVLNVVVLGDASPLILVVCLALR